jgi:hypothetical protein
MTANTFAEVQKKVSQIRRLPGNNKYVSMKRIPA